jgi:hypothetical protein
MKVQALPKVQSEAVAQQQAADGSRAALAGDLLAAAHERGIEQPKDVEFVGDEASVGEETACETLLDVAHIERDDAQVRPGMYASEASNSAIVQPLTSSIKRRPRKSTTARRLEGVRDRNARCAEPLLRMPGTGSVKGLRHGFPCFGAQAGCHSFDVAMANAPLRPTPPRKSHRSLRNLQPRWRRCLESAQQ